MNMHGWQLARVPGGGAARSVPLQCWMAPSSDARKMSTPQRRAQPGDCVSVRLAL